MATMSSLMTAEELLALPDDDIDRELIRGELTEYSTTTHTAPHCRAMANLAKLICVWLERQPEPRGSLYTGNIGVRVDRDPDTFVGMDLA